MKGGGGCQSIQYAVLIAAFAAVLLTACIFDTDDADDAVTNLTAVVGTGSGEEGAGTVTVRWSHPVKTEDLQTFYVYVTFNGAETDAYFYLYVATEEMKGGLNDISMPYGLTFLVENPQVPPHKVWYVPSENQYKFLFVDLPAGEYKFEVEPRYSAATRGTSKTVSATVPAV